ncbi:MAG: undecaprenyldiphospho-muramoylpentapeptide beta-N-acetylglucosaminyltransferase [Defluviitaleaceae bacterium]|nr:undecaprenyldiphospho-muramoylpentapeptide beta-N-acetylglucosaminyltransferase [Defluviitaleaceae bacterium]
MVRVLLTGGGTGGHIYPALSMMKAIKAEYPDATFLYIGTPNGLESKIVPTSGVPFESVKVSGIRRSLSLDNVKTLYHFVTAIGTAKKYIKAFNPDVVIGTGGYVCAPVVYAAAKLKFKTVIHEQNSLPGITNKFLARHVDKILICFEEAKHYFPVHKLVLTGNPRATEVATTLKLGKTALGLNPHKKTVLISGGSRGAKPINTAFVSMIEKYEQSNFEVVFVTGEVHYASICEQIGELEAFKNVKIKPFIADMPKFLVNIDLFVGRSGATFLSEITALGVPSILIPSPYVAENHQEFNARSITDHGGGTLVLEYDLTGEVLYKEITRLLNDEKILTSMRHVTKKLGIPDANTRILNVIGELI